MYSTCTVQYMYCIIHTYNILRLWREYDVYGINSPQRCRTVHTHTYHACGRSGGYWVSLGWRNYLDGWPPRPPNETVHYVFYSPCWVVRQFRTKDEGRRTEYRVVMKNRWGLPNTPYMCGVHTVHTSCCC
jgi:hypothetical protein